MNIITVRRQGDDYGPLEIEFGSSWLFEWALDRERSDMAVASARVTIRKGSNVYVDDVAADVSDNVVSFLWPAASQPDQPNSDILVEVTVTPVDTAERSLVAVREVVDLVRVPLTVPIVEADLFNRYPLLRDARRLGLEEGEADPSSTAGTLVAAQLAIYESGFYVGGEVEIIEGPSAGEWRSVVEFTSTGSLGSAVIDPPFSTPLTEDSQFRIRQSWQPIIAEAWADIRKKVRDRGNRPALIMDGQAFRQTLLTIAGGMAFAALSGGDEDDPMQMQGDRLSQRGWLDFDSTRFVYDERDSGDPSGDIKQQVVHVSRR